MDEAWGGTRAPIRGKPEARKRLTAREVLDRTLERYPNTMRYLGEGVGS